MLRPLRIILRAALRSLNERE
ncbi:protein of unknown function [Methylorubrum extorquens]|uniref:Uncharacterized protein n=1 Tax=Methylorubrum extorquens TaxID=408 RepID=A0A2N9ARC9_METEX|nr:protein of unknown function [Methylorubrum extorquens]